MAKSAAIIGKGTTLGYNDVGGTGSVTSIAELKSVNQPKISVGNFDATHYTSPNSTVEKKSIVWKDVDDIPGRINYTKAQLTTLNTIMGVEKTFTILMPDASTFVFDGFLSSLGGNEIPNKSGIESDFSITVTGPVVFTAGS